MRPLQGEVPFVILPIASPMRGGAPKGAEGWRHGGEREQAVSPLRVRCAHPLPLRGEAELPVITVLHPAADLPILHKHKKPPRTRGLFVFVQNR